MDDEIHPDTITVVQEYGAFEVHSEDMPPVRFIETPSQDSGKADAEAPLWFAGIRVGDTVEVDVPEFGNDRVIGIVEGIDRRWGEEGHFLRVRLYRGLGDLVLLPRQAVTLLADPDFGEIRR